MRHHTLRYTIITLGLCAATGWALSGAKTPVPLEPSVANIVPSDRLVTVQATDPLLARRLDRLSQSMEALVNDQKALAEDLDDVASAQPLEEEPLTPAETMAKVDRESRAQAQLLEHSLRGQGIDPEWTGAAVSQVKQSFRDSGLQGMTLSRVDCARNMCRLELSFLDVEARLSGMGQTPFLVPWAGEAFFQVDGPAGLNAGIFVAREGTTLPRSS